MKIYKPIFSVLFSFCLVLSPLLISFIFNPSVSATVFDPTPLVTFTGDGVIKGFTSRNMVVGDVNNDGYDDFVIHSGKMDSIGKIYIFYGGSDLVNKTASEADVTITAEGVGGFYGETLAIGDINNDGFDDIITSAYIFASLQGRVYIFYGSDSLSNKNASEADTLIIGETSSALGASLEVEDLNSDGYKDITIGAWFYASSTGRVYVIYGRDNPLEDKDFSGSDTADVVITGETVGDDFGTGVSAADINHDGYNDLIAGAMWNDRGAPKGGSVYIFYGSANGIDSPQNADSADAIISCSDIATSVNGIRFGNVVDGGGDINNDGIDDFIVGAYDNDVDGVNAGRVYVFYGSTSFSSSKDANLADVIYTGDPSDNIGSTVAIIDDVNNDGLDDILMSAPYHNNSKGQVYLVFGSSTLVSKPAIQADIVFTGENNSDYFSFLSNSGDINGDSWQEFILGSYRWPANAYTGKAYLYNFNNNPSLSVNDNTYIDNSVGITGTASFISVNVSGVQISVDSGDWIACSAADGAFDSASESYTCSLSGLSEGSHSVRVKSYDVNNIYIPSSLYATDEFIVDTTAPTGTISINSDETITNTDEVTLTLSATDNLSGISKMMVSNKVDYSGGTWETYNTSKEWRLSMGDGEKRVYVKYRDEVGNISESYEDSIEMDMGAPTGTLVINEGEEYTSSREVVLHITGEDEVTGVEEMRISEDRTMEGVEWEGYETSREYTLSEGDGYKVIYIQYRDGIGNESEVYGSNITLDRNTEIDITEIGEEEVEGEIVNWETEETTPTFTGEGEVGATITIEIEGIETGTVIVNEDGVWSWTPSIELTRGQEYNVTIISTDLVGNEDTQTFTLGISDEEVINVDQTTPETQITTTQLPNTGVIFIIGLMILGGLLSTGVNFKVIEKLKKKN